MSQTIKKTTNINTKTNTNSNPITIYHNPNCGTSRNVLAMIRAAGVEPVVVQYLKTPLTRADLTALVKKLGVPVRAVLREKGTPYAELNLSDNKWTEDDLLGFIEVHPILLNRPIVVSEKGAKLCRPSEAVLDLLPTPLTQDFVKEDGEVVSTTQNSY